MSKKYEKTVDICGNLLYILSVKFTKVYYVYENLFNFVFVPVVTDEGTRPSGGSSQSVIFYAFFFVT